MKVTITILLLSFSLQAFAQKIKSVEYDDATIMYDSLGNPKELITRREGVNTVTYKSEYDKQSRLVLQEKLMNSFPMTKTINQYDANRLVRTDNYQRTKFGTVHKYAIMEYDKRDSLTRKVVFSDKGDTLEIFIRSYNKEGKLATEVDKDYEYKFLTRKEFGYLSNGNLEKTLRTDLESPGDTSELTELKVLYNKHGDMIRREEWSLNGSLLMVDDREISISTEETRNGIKGYLVVYDFEYNYDPFNNWTQMDSYYYNAVEKTKGKTSTKRLIKYY
jgi:hypothetical protein